MRAGDFTALNGAGLKLQAVFDLDRLPVEMAAALRGRYDPAHRYRQLILIGHGGTSLWEAVEASGMRSENPIDDFSVRTVERWFAEQFPDTARQIIYPGDIPADLQALGRIAGWHHASPFMLGINADWGTWFAYRVVLLAATDLEPTRPVEGKSPCARCADKPCIAACPAGAMDGGSFALDKCIGYRRQASSRCKATCVARISCPVGSAHRYGDKQMRHAYSISLREIERHG